MNKKCVPEVAKLNSLHKSILEILRSFRLSKILSTAKLIVSFKGIFVNKLSTSNEIRNLLLILPKLHKLKDDDVKPKFRPIVSSIGSYNYNFSKFLGNLLSPYINMEYTPKDSFTFVKELNEVSFNNKFLISFDVESLFTNIPLNETINLAVDKILDNRKDLKISRIDLCKLFNFATSGTHFLFNNQYYEQTDGVAMGSPLAPILANFFMGHFETIWLNEYTGNKPTYYKRYVDDIFACFDNKNDSENFLIYLNSKHPNIKFTSECEQDGKLPFLDVCINNNNNKLMTSIFRKKTYTGLLTNYLSFTSFSYKLGLIKTLLDRAYKINSEWTGIHNDFSKIKTILQKNLYPPTLIDKCTKTYLNSKYEEKPELPKENCHYFKLPYIGKFSDLLQKKVLTLSNKYCKTVKIKVVCTSFKIKQMLSTKDQLPISLKSCLIYKFNCANCNVCYIGETTRHLSTRIKEHLQTDKKSHVYKHLQNDVQCFDKCGKECFSIIDSSTSQYQLKIKEGLHIEWEKPILNKQVGHYNITLF